MGRLDGKVAVITGAASGMGRAASVLFSREGAHVVLADLNGPGGEAVAQEASDAGQRCVFQRTDVSAEADIQALVARALSEFGRLDIMFNNAGIGGAVGSLETIAVEDWDRTQAVCLRGVFLGIKHSIAPMRAQGGGAIVSTASIAGIDGYPNLHAYCAAKAGVVNLTRSASIEYAADKIRINCIAPGGTPRRSSAAARPSTSRRSTRLWCTPSHCRWPASRRTSPRQRCSWPATPHGS